jgi:hypothetical protein
MIGPRARGIHFRTWPHKLGRKDDAGWSVQSRPPRQRVLQRRLDSDAVDQAARVHARGPSRNTTLRLEPRPWLRAAWRVTHTRACVRCASQGFWGAAWERFLADVCRVISGS